MPTVAAKVIDKPKENTRTVIVPTLTALPAFVGSGKTNYSCGICHTILILKIYHGQLRNLVIKCPKCNAFNEIP